jgi:hypothetical protein
VRRLLREEEPRDAREARGALKALAEASGGLDYYPKDPAEMERVTPQITHETAINICWLTRPRIRHWARLNWPGATHVTL